MARSWQVELAIAVFQPLTMLRLQLKVRSLMKGFYGLIPDEGIALFPWSDDYGIFRETSKEEYRSRSKRTMTDDHAR
mgnify:CR=1 FL=1